MLQLWRGFVPSIFFGEHMYIVTLDPIQIDDWIFKVSVNQDIGVIMVCAFNQIMLYHQVNFFTSDAMAENWMGYVVETTKYEE